MRPKLLLSRARCADSCFAAGAVESLGRVAALGQERPSLNPPLEGTSRRWLPGDIHKMMDSLTLRFDEPLVALLRSDTV